jgi:transposase
MQLRMSEVWYPSIVTEKKPKPSYRIRNWKHYNKALVKRGSLTLWVEQKSLDAWLNSSPSVGRGRPHKYADLAIEALLVLREVFHLPLRNTQGFASSLFHLLQLDLPVPDYSTLSRRARRLDVRLKSPSQSIKRLLIDSSGLKVFGEGEWKVRTHGADYQRTWRKLHISMDAASQQITAALITDNKTLDRKALPLLLNQTGAEVEKVCADGAYDTIGCYKAIKQRGALGVIPPKSNAVIGGGKWFEDRDEHLRKIQQTDLKEWKKQSQYHRRSVVECGFFRLKAIFSDKLRSRREDTQSTEAMIRCATLNRMTQLGMPESYMAR